MTPELISVIIAVFVQSVAVAFFFGRVFNTVEENTEDIKGLGVTLRKEFHDMFEAKQDLWQVKFISMMDTNDIQHTTIDVNLTQLTAELKESHAQAEKANGVFWKKLDTMTDCLHKIQNQKEC